MHDLIVLARHLEFPELQGSGKVPNSVITQVNEQVVGRQSEEGHREWHQSASWEVTKGSLGLWTGANPIY